MKRQADQQVGLRNENISEADGFGKPEPDHQPPKSIRGDPASDFDAAELAAFWSSKERLAEDL